MIISPCISICKINQETGYCHGCGRDILEIKLWKEAKTTNQWKKQNILNIQKRLNNLQLKNFKESYEYKIKNGISLLKKKKIESKI